MGEPAPTSAAIEGPDWSAKAAGWAELWAGLADPAREAVAEATGIGTGMRVLDVGCGSGEFCMLAAARGAVVSGIDAAEGMVEIARRRLPGADLRVGAMERLPWDDDGFDLVTAFNAIQFDVPYEAPDRETLERALLVDAACIGGTEHAREAAVRKVIAEAAAPFRRPDSSYRFENRFRYVVSEVARHQRISLRSM